MGVVNLYIRPGKVNVGKSSPGIGIIDPIIANLILIFLIK